jgi:hypothetical protein
VASGFVEPLPDGLLRGADRLMCRIRLELKLGGSRRARNLRSRKLEHALRLGGSRPAQTLAFRLHLLRRLRLEPRDLLFQTP